MSLGSPPSSRFRGSLKHFARHAKEVFRPTGYRMPLSSPQPSIGILVPQLRPVQPGKKVGADAWSGLKVTLQLLEESDLFLPLKPAIAGLLEVLKIFKVIKFILCVVPWRLSCSEYRKPPRAEKTMQSLEIWLMSSGNTQGSTCLLRCWRL